ncbi:alpha/beta fold hydrolase [Spirillospora sp. NPDC048832]
MTTFVLVHGAWHGPWAWDRVVPLLEDAGHRTINVDLHGDHGLRDHVRLVTAALDNLPDKPDKAVLVGHSYAGLVVREAADARPDRVRHIVLVDGWAGPDGASMFGLAPASFIKQIGALTEAGDDERWIPAPPPQAFGVTDPADVDWLAPRLVPQPLRTFTDATRLLGAVDLIPGTAICCAPPTFAFDRFARSIGYRTLTVDGPHNVMLTHPEPLARMLLDVTDHRDTLQEQEARSLQ